MIFLPLSKLTGKEHGKYGRLVNKQLAIIVFCASCERWTRKREKENLILKRVMSFYSHFPNINALYCF